jgi:hypothetical protein
MIFSGASLGGQNNGWLAVVSILVPPIVATVTLTGLMWVFDVGNDERYTALAIIAFLLSLVVYRELAAVS